MTSEFRVGRGFQKVPKYWTLWGKNHRTSVGQKWPKTSNVIYGRSNGKPKAKWLYWHDHEILFEEASLKRLLRLWKIHEAARMGSFNNYVEFFFCHLLTPPPPAWIVVIP